MQDRAPAAGRPPPAAQPWLDPALLRERFWARVEVLRALEPVWAHRPFVEPSCPWAAQAPAVEAWLLALAPEELERAEAHPELAAAPAPWAEWTQAARVDEPGLWAEVPAKAQIRGITERKSSQVLGFVEAVLPRLRAGGPLVDWCCGLGNLGRALAARSGAELVGVELDPGLCQTGQALARAAGLRARFVCADALGPEAARALGPGVQGVALHACGLLGDTLLEEGTRRGAALLALAPCCYHRRPPEDPVLRSQAGRAAGLGLLPDQLRLATAEEVVATARVRGLRRQEQAWRQGLEWIAAQARGDTRYLGFPSVRGWTGVGDFEGFCRRLAARKGFALPQQVDWARAEAIGWERARVARALGVPRALFRRALEQLVVLDRALALLEAGRPVGLGRFAPRERSPRDLLLISDAG